MPAVVPPDGLEEVALFTGLLPSDREMLGLLLHSRIVPARTALMTAEQPGEAVYFILKGTVKIYVEQADGTGVILALLGPGEVVGEMSAVDNLVRSASAATLEECSLLWMARHDFQECFRTIPALGLNLARILSRRLRLANAQIQALAALDVHGRVARQILAFAEECGHATPRGSTVIPLRLTQNDLAGLVGASRVRVNQALLDFRQRSVISVDGERRITVHDVAALARSCR